MNFSPFTRFFFFAGILSIAGLPVRSATGAERPNLLIIAIDDLRDYLTCVSYIDAQVGKLAAKLEATGLAENTVIALWSDHGYQLGHHNMWCKHSNFETSTRVPFILSDPRIPGPGDRRIRTPVELLDLYPTLVDLSGFEIPDHCQGKSLAPALRDPIEFEKRDLAAFSQFNKGGYHGHSMRTADFRLTEWRSLKKKGEVIYELFDHTSDPEENRNVAPMEEYSGILDSLRQRLETEWH